MEKNQGQVCSTGQENYQVKFPIGVKLAIIIGFIVLVSLGLVTFLNSHFIGQDVQITAENSNLSVNSRSAITVEDKLNVIRSNVFQLLDLLNVVSGGRSSVLARQAESFFFERNQDIAAIYILSESSVSKQKSTDIRILNNSFFISNETDAGAMDLFLQASEEAVRRSCNGETVALNVSPYFETPAMALLFPYSGNGRNQTCIITFSIETISDILGTDSINQTFIINDSDELLCHPATKRVLRGESLKNDALVMEMRRNNQNNDDSRQILYEVTDSSGKKSRYYGAYKKLAFGDIVILTTVPFDTILEGVITTRKNNIYLTCIVFFLSVMFILFFARFGISRHLRRLTEAADEIKNGNFETPVISMLNTKRRDEIGVLNQSTKDEREFLNLFAKFTNKGVARAIARKEIDFEPHLKDVTIFFSDIRGFTAISDGFKNRFANDSPREIISFLNDYMSRMVNCITLSHGNVDKFEGDAIMAAWGVLRDDNLDYEQLADEDPQKKILKAKHEQHKKEDALSAIQSTVAMRYALMKYNKDALKFTEEHAQELLAKYKPEIKIGCGINSGRATVGFMGSNEKMEFTSIGDAVNLASRTESSNKPCGTDILITEDTYNILKTDFIRCEENNYTISKENEKNEIIVECIPVTFEVKGKGAQHFYAVVNMPHFDIENFFKASDSDFKVDEDCLKAVGKQGPATLAQVRQMLGIPVPDFEVVDLNEEENKVKAQ